MMRSIFRSAFLLALVAAALSAHAQAAPTAAFSSTLYTVQRPADASAVTVAFAGTISSSSPLNVVSFSGRSGTSALDLSDGVPISAINSALASSATYSGTLITYTFRGAAASSPTPLGLASVNLGFNFDNGTSAASRLTVNVTPVPEPSALATLGLGSVALIGRRRRARALASG